MTDNEFSSLKSRIESLATYWMYILGLCDWRVIQRNYDRQYKADHVDCAADVSVQWEYREGLITFYMPKINQYADDLKELEYIVVHELCHFLVNQMRPAGEASDHEEFVVTTLARAYIWAHRSGCGQLGEPLHPWRSYQQTLALAPVVCIDDFYPVSN